MTGVLFTLSGATQLAEGLARELQIEQGEIEQRHFPDGEAYLRLMTPVGDRNVVLLCTLDQPNQKILPLVFAADAARRLGARNVGLIAPYLAYMRQDKAFHTGEAVTSATFANILSTHFDWIVSLDPHLHRIHDLGEIYSIPNVAATAAGPIAEWVRANVDRPFLVGPDGESNQWVERIASLLGVPAAVFHKTRRGDFDVRVEGKAQGTPCSGTPVVIDDIASSARTMIGAVDILRIAGGAAPVCIVVHALFAGDGFEKLVAAGPAAIVSTNSVSHPSNGIDITAPLAEAAKRVFLASGASPLAARTAGP